MPTTELATKATKADIEKAYKAIMDGETVAVSDPEIVSRAIMERIIGAETFEQAFAEQSLEPWREGLIDEPVLVHGFHLNPSGFEGEGSSSVYAVVDLERLSDAERMTVTCGGRNVLVQLVKMLEKGWLDKPVKLTAKQTREGYTALWLVAA